MVGLAKFSDSSFTTTFVESMGLPPPRLIRESALAFCAWLIACFISLIGACCLIPVKTPASFLSDARFHSSWLGPMVDSSPVEGERPYFNASTAAEVSAYVVEDFVAVNVAVVVWDGYGLGVVVEFSRDEG